MLLAVARAIPDWQSNKQQSRFRHWLHRITKNAILNALTRGPKDPAVGGSGFMNLIHGVSKPDNIELQLELEYRRQVYRQAAEIVRDAVQEQTWRVFVMTIIEGQSTESVARQMSTTIGNVHAIRSRVMRRLQIAVKDIQEADE